MKILIDGFIEFYGDRVKLVKTLMKRQSPEKFPEVLKWVFQTLYFHEGVWVEICRIDNYLHEKQSGSHIHYYGRKEVRRIALNYREAEKAIKDISERIIRERFNDVVRFPHEKL